MKSHRPLLRPFLLIAAIGLAIPSARADRYATLVSGGSVSVSSGETALVISCHNYSTSTTSGVNLRYAQGGGGSVDVVITPAGFVKQYQSAASASAAAAGSGPSLNAPIPLVGPATISIPSGGGILGLKIVSTEITSGGGGSSGGSSSAQGTPSNAVVIPTDATGPVDIVLESSTDLVTWTGANPGTYGATTTKRFFRVRAINQAP